MEVKRETRRKHIQAPVCTNIPAAWVIEFVLMCLWECIRPLSDFPCARRLNFCACACACFCACGCACECECEFECESECMCVCVCILRECACA